MRLTKRTLAGARPRGPAARRPGPLTERRTTKHQPRRPETPQASQGGIDERPLMLSVEQVCRLLGVGRTTLWAMVRDGEIGAVKRGARLLFPLPIVEDYVAEQAVRAREQAEQRQRLRRYRGPGA